MRAARQACKVTQADIALVLGISRAAYQKYETRTLLPHYLVEEFAAITGVDIKDLYRPG